MLRLVGLFLICLTTFPAFGQSTSKYQVGTITEVKAHHAGGNGASDAASYVTGALWLVDGGITAGKGPVGALAKPEVTKPPASTIDLHHSHDGTRNKKIVKIA